jgi:hypothetical protein
MSTASRVRAHRERERLGLAVLRITVPAEQAADIQSEAESRLAAYRRAALAGELGEDLRAAWAERILREAQQARD